MPDRDPLTPEELARLEADARARVRAFVADPRVVLRLLAQVAAAEQEVARLRNGLQVVRRDLSAAEGNAVGAKAWWYRCRIKDIDAVVADPPAGGGA